MSAVNALLALVGHALARLRARWDALCAPEVAVDLSDDDDADIPPTSPML